MKAKMIAIITFPFQFLQGIFMIFRMLFGGRGQSEVAVHNSDGHDGHLDTVKYDNMLGQPTAEIVSGMQPVFCPKCHKLVAHIRETNQRLEIFQDGKKLLTVGGDGKKQSGVPLSCLNGHRVMVVNGRR